MNTLSVNLQALRANLQARVDAINLLMGPCAISNGAPKTVSKTYMSLQAPVAESLQRRSRQMPAAQKARLSRVMKLRWRRARRAGKSAL